MKCAGDASHGGRSIGRGNAGDHITYARFERGAPHDLRIARRQLDFTWATFHRQRGDQHRSVLELGKLAARIGAHVDQPNQAGRHSPTSANQRNNIALDVETDDAAGIWWPFQRRRRNDFCMQHDGCGDKKIGNVGIAPGIGWRSRRRFRNRRISAIYR